MKFLIGLFGFLSGCFVSAMVILLIQGIWDFKVNIVDLLMLVATIVLSIAVIYLTKALNLKSASNLNGNLNCSKELEHYAS